MSKSLYMAVILGLFQFNILPSCFLGPFLVVGLNKSKFTYETESKVTCCRDNCLKDRLPKEDQKIKLQVGKVYEKKSKTGTDCLGI